jgi:hypothetical protein
MRWKRKPAASGSDARGLKSTLLDVGCGDEHGKNVCYWWGNEGYTSGGRLPYRFVVLFDGLEMRESRARRGGAGGESG